MKDKRKVLTILSMNTLAFTICFACWIMNAVLGSKATKSEAQAIAGVDELAVEEATTFPCHDQSALRILVRTGRVSFVVHSWQRPRLLCPVVPAINRGKLHGPCHIGWFDPQTSKPVAGPPRRKLPSIHLEARGGLVCAVGVEETAT